MIFYLWTKHETVSKTPLKFNSLPSTRRFITFITIIIIEMNSLHYTLFLKYLSFFYFISYLSCFIRHFIVRVLWIYIYMKIPSYVATFYCFSFGTTLNNQNLKGVVVVSYVWYVAFLMTTMMIIIIIHNIHLSFSHFLFMSVVFTYIFSLQAS